MAEFATKPLEIDLDRERELRIRWADGHESRYPLGVLRRNCPCAACRAARDEQQRSGGLPVLKPSVVDLLAVQAEHAELVGHYALRITWADRHAAGIYDFAYLRALDAAAEDPHVPPQSPRTRTNDAPGA